MSSASCLVAEPKPSLKFAGGRPLDVGRRPPRPTESANFADPLRRPPDELLRPSGGPNLKPATGPIFARPLRGLPSVHPNRPGNAPEQPPNPCQTTPYIDFPFPSSTSPVHRRKKYVPAPLTSGAKYFFASALTLLDFPIPPRPITPPLHSTALLLITTSMVSSSISPVALFFSPLP